MIRHLLAAEPGTLSEDIRIRKEAPEGIKMVPTLTSSTANGIKEPILQGS